MIRNGAKIRIFTAFLLGVFVPSCLLQAGPFERRSDGQQTVSTRAVDPNEPTQEEIDEELRPIPYQKVSGEGIQNLANNIFLFKPPSKKLIFAEGHRARRSMLVLITTHLIICLITTHLTMWLPNDNYLIDN